MPSIQQIIHNIQTDPVARRGYSFAMLSDFHLFIKVMFFILEGKMFSFQSFHFKIIECLQDITLCKNKKQIQIINIPPRYGKTTLMTYFVAWSYLINQKCNFIYTSYADELVCDISDRVKFILKNDFLTSLFDINILKTKDSKRLWKVEDGGVMLASAQGGVITGFGAGMMDSNLFGGALVIDDPIKPDNTRTETMREQSINYYRNTLSTRLNNPNLTPIIVIMQRLHTEDLTGYLLKKYPDNVRLIKYPALNEETGEVLWEGAKYSRDALLSMKAAEPFKYYSQYQQEPVIAGGNVIKSEWFCYYDTVAGIKFSRVFVTSDTAMKTKEHNDYSVFCVWGVGADGLYLLDMMRDKWEAPELKQTALTIWAKWKMGCNNVLCSAFYVEDKASGTGLIQEIKRTCVPIIAVGRTVDKLTRLNEVASYIAAGKIFLPTPAQQAFVDVFISECIAFSRDLSHKHDDIVDCLIDAINYGIGGTGVLLQDYIL